MKKWMCLMVAVGCVGLAMGGIRVMAEETPAADTAKAAVAQCVYTCPDCHVMALKDGKCPKCQKEMTAAHVLGVKDGKALLCACSATCKCDAATMKDGKCACGKEVVKMSATGMYVCSKGCPEISDKPGKCACGNELKKVE